MEITSTEAQNNFGRYLKLVQYEDIEITKNGKRIALLTSDRGSSVNQPGAVAERAGAYTARPRLTLEEFFILQETSENRYEYLDGEVYVLAAPSYHHQRMVTELVSGLQQWFKGKSCVPLTAPFDVTLYKDEGINIVQPDILVICDKEHINDKGKYKGIPSLVVEVLSASTRSKDMVKKLDLYVNSGVKEYWIVNPSSSEIYVYAMQDCAIEEYCVYRAPDILKSVIFQGLALELTSIFESG